MNLKIIDEGSDAAGQQFLHDWEMELNRVHAKIGDTAWTNSEIINFLNMSTARIAM